MNAVMHFGWLDYMIHFAAIGIMAVVIGYVMRDKK